MGASTAAPKLEDVADVAPAVMANEGDEAAGAFQNLLFRTEELIAASASPGDATPIVFFDALREVGLETMAHFGERYLLGHTTDREEPAARIYLRAFSYFLAANDCASGDPAKYGAYLERMFESALRDPKALVEQVEGHQNKERLNVMGRRVTEELRALCNQVSDESLAGPSAAGAVVNRIVKKAIEAQPKLW